jgi:hypothetical protein
MTDFQVGDAVKSKKCNYLKPTGSIGILDRFIEDSDLVAITFVRGGGRRKIGIYARPTGRGDWLPIPMKAGIMMNIRDLELVPR